MTDLDVELDEECPAGGPHEWAELESWDHRRGWGCENCGESLE